MTGMYDLDDSKQKIQILQQLAEIQLDIEVFRDLLEKHGIISSLEYDAAKKYYMSQPKYQALFEQLNRAQSTINHYKDDPQAYLRDLMKAKLQGKE